MLTLGAALKKHGATKETTAPQVPNHGITVIPT